MIYIKEIALEEILPIRQSVMYPDKTLEELKLPEDNAGKHLGLFVDEKLCCVVSLFLNPTTAQFRKFATVESLQGKGYGTLLLEHIIKECKNAGCSMIWCNARTTAIGFYERFGFKSTDKIYLKDGFNFVVMEKDLN